MRKLARLADRIHEELNDAQHYAECYVEYKTLSDSGRMSKMKEMANDELKHAMYVHDIMAQEVSRYKDTIDVPQEMLDNWQTVHKVYVDKAGYIKQMLTL